MVPSRNEFENYHSYINRSFQTHRFHFATDGKMKPLCRTLFIKFFTVRIKYIKKNGIPVFLSFHFAAVYEAWGIISPL
ncbi:hypothetical protein DWQ65_10325 [Treponema phagedenis]|nr:hypothetical protein FUT79_14795 [Treponema phagedenis]QEK02144.1 hypothetical protein FUT84_13900 [Treponema phagedenis]QEK05076.1 hypothetical protein FUT83_15555 [Treponema phagedenis]QEK07381.1 hypothetical protein FUT80_12060 [Treponema phagedenis]QEK10697.1 hypothetical protein FUT81_15470 [Treponema phagedenis]